MVSAVRWAPSYRLVASKYPMKGVYDRIVDTAHFAELLEIEALTNPRALEEAGDFRKIRAEDFVSGPGTTPIMASFAYAGTSRFCDGTFGVYYAANDEATAIAESLYHTERRMREWGEPSIDLDKRMYTARIVGDYDDVRDKSPKAKVYNPDPAGYAYAQRYARKLYESNAVDGIVYNSVRYRGGECVVAFRPRLISDCKVYKYLQFRWDGARVISVAELTAIREYPEETAS